MERILIIDDSPTQADFLRSILCHNYDITIVNVAEEGLRCAKDGSFSLILLDVVMPGMDGFVLLKKLQEEVVTRHTPVILITSLADEASEERGLTLGAVDYIRKPFRDSIVLARVNTHVKLYCYRIQVEQQAMVDQLTGVANRRRYEGESLSKWREAIRFGMPLSICMFDIDKFKLYNDTFGHPAGDQVISAVAKTASSYFQRSMDLFARYGGEEFIAVFVGSDGHNAFEFLKTIRQAVEDLHIPHCSPVSQWVTVSVGGVSLIPKVGDSYDTYLKLADTMLYDAKRLGRNRVVWSYEGKEQWFEKE